MSELHDKEQEIKRLRLVLQFAKDAMQQALAYADADESDGYAEHWTKNDTDVDWCQVRSAINKIKAVETNDD